MIESFDTRFFTWAWAAVLSACALSVDLRTTSAQETDDLFRTSDRCIACHKGITDRDGTDVSIGFDWRASMMANSARDPYFLAALSREIADHPEAADAIEGECSVCHAPMARRVIDARGGPEHDPGSVSMLEQERDALVTDGVSCAVCHQILPDGIGSESTFSGRFALTRGVPSSGRPMFGPFAADEGGAGIMHSATGFLPTEGTHVQKSGLCASCHTLTTRGIRSDGSRGRDFLEQAPYLEWLASSYASDGRSCQDCHMPEAAGEVPVTRVLGTPRPNVSRHVFRGGNFFVLRMLNRYRDELGVEALPQELALAADRTEDHLREATATVSLDAVGFVEGRLEATVLVSNLAGHKFPTAYPSRRAWLRFTVETSMGQRIFQSGGLLPDGRVMGDDHDDDPMKFEPHYEVITSPDQVQVYQAVMADESAEPTTALMRADHWIKDNRILPQGFDEATADERVAMTGRARSDSDFVGGRDEVRYSVAADPADGPVTVSVALLFQPIGFRWAENLAEYDTPEAIRFVRYYREMAQVSSIVISETSAEVDGNE